MANSRTIILVISLALVAGAIYYLQSQKLERGGMGAEEVVARDSAAKEAKAKKYPLAKEITTPDGFINTDPSTGLGTGKVSVSEFIGKKIVLVDFWTYSCINCQRTTPYLNAWYEKYKDKGLVIIGVHTPEFDFEKEYENVKRAVEKFGIKYPVVLDNDYSTWTAYKNRYWPRKYLIDIDGYIVYDHVGEGAYEETEKKIQELLEERKMALGIGEEIETDIARPQDMGGIDVPQPRTPEIYFGAARNEHLGKELKLSGDWEIKNEFAENKKAGAKIILRYQAKNVYFVAGSESGSKIKILKDGKLIGETDVREYKLYPIIQDSDHGTHTLEIIIESPGLRAFTFTFG